MKIIKSTVFLLAMLVFGIKSFSQDSNKTNNQADKMSQRIYGLVFINVKDEVKFKEYGKLANPFVNKYGGGIERSIKVEDMMGEGLNKPDIINVTYMDNMEAFQKLNSDQEFLKLMPIRAESSEMSVVFGGAGNNDFVNNSKGTSKRYFLIELAYYSDPDGLAYQEYGNAMMDMMKDYEYHMERTIIPSQAMGLEKPSIVNIMYYDTQEEMSKALQDKRHEKIGGELYPKAVSKSIWFTGRSND